MILPGSNTLNWLSISWATVTPITVTVAANLHSACGTFYSDKTLWISNKSSACKQHGPHRQATTQTDRVCASLFTRLITQSFQRVSLLQPGPKKQVCASNLKTPVVSPFMFLLIFLIIQILLYYMPKSVAGKSSLINDFITNWNLLVKWK